MNNWEQFVQTDSTKRYVLPKGWDSKEVVANKLGCSDDQVRKILSPAIKDGTIETSAFPVWDKMTKRVNRTTAYRRVPPAVAKAPGKALPLVKVKK